MLLLSHKKNYRTPHTQISCYDFQTQQILSATIQGREGGRGREGERVEGEREEGERVEGGRLEAPLFQTQ